VEVIDNGAGMTAEFLRDRLFRPFETTKTEGVGLGLTTAQQIVRFHKGSLRVLSQPGRFRAGVPAGGTLTAIPQHAQDVPGQLPATARQAPATATARGTTVGTTALKPITNPCC